MTTERTITLATENDTHRFAARVAAILKTGDTLLLSGEIGAGKSAFSRAVIRTLARAEIDVPSPTFTLVQTYEVGACDIWHCDLYRLTHPDEAFELGLDEAFQDAICLIEWPDRLGDLAPDDALTLHFAANPDGHSVSFTASEKWAARLDGVHD